MTIPSGRDAGRVLLLLPTPDEGLQAWLERALAGATIESAPFALADWLRVAFDPILAGVVLDAEAVSLADLRTVSACLEREPRPWLVALSGDRGVAGCEDLLTAPRTAVLPKPWTPAGVAQALRRARAEPERAAARGGASDAFLTGLVEGLRDPLSSLGGYLQLMQHHADAGSAELLRPALESARSLERQIESLYLAAAPMEPRPQALDLRALAAELLQEARRDDARVEADLPPGDWTVEADLRFVRAALGASRLLLERFGPGGALRLQGIRDLDGWRLSWEAEASASMREVAGARAPPGFLEELIERLAARAPAQAVFDRLRGAVPVSAGLRFAQILAPLRGHSAGRRA